MKFKLPHRPSDIQGIVQVQLMYVDDVGDYISP